MDLDKLSLSDKIIAATGIVLIIDLLFLPWHSIDVGPFIGDALSSGGLGGGGASAPLSRASRSCLRAWLIARRRSIGSSCGRCAACTRR